MSALSAASGVDSADPGRSALVRALRLMLRTAGPALTAIVLTAGVQALLMYLNVQSGPSVSFLASFAVSALVTLALYAVLTASALAAVDTAGSGRAPVRAGGHLGLFAAWVLAQWLAVLAVSVVTPWAIALVAAATPYLPLAALDGRRNALAVSLRAIGQRPGRWAITTLVLLGLGLLLFLGSVANTLFVKGTPAAALFWLVVGVAAWWVLTVWALVLRSCPVGSQQRAGTAAADTSTNAP